MRVLHLTDDPVGLSGVRSYLLELGRALAPFGVDGRLHATARPGGPVRDQVTRWAGLGYARELADRIRVERPDVVHAHNVWMRLSPLPLRAARGAGVPVVMTVHDYHLVCPRKWMITPDDHPCETGFGPRCLVLDCRGSREGLGWLPYNQLRWLKVALHRRMLRAWVDLFVSPSRHLAGWLKRSLAPSRVEVVPNFARAPAEPEPSPGEPAALLYCGRLGREKGVDVLLRALPLVRAERPEVSLTVAGDGPERPRLEALTRELGLHDAVELTGTLAGERLAERYRRAGVCVLPTLWMENCPVAVLEAMAWGRPVVATRIGGIPELVEDGVTGRLVPREDHHELADALLQLVRDPDRAAAMGAAARSVHRQRFSPSSHASRLAGLYRELCDAGGRP